MAMMRRADRQVSGELHGNSCDGLLNGSWTGDAMSRVMCVLYL